MISKAYRNDNQSHITISKIEWFKEIMKESYGEIKDTWMESTKLPNLK